MVIETDTRAQGRRNKHNAAAKGKAPDAKPRKPEEKESPLDYLPTSDSTQPDVDASDVIY
jgi:hypothetical protein